MDYCSLCIRFLRLMIIFFSLFDSAQAFVVRSHPTKLSSSIIKSVSNTALLERKKDISSYERGSGEVNKLIGIDRGYFLFVPLLFVLIWSFTIPVEFRRARICNEEDSRKYPTKCMTSDQFKRGISDYYKNGAKEEGILCLVYCALLLLPGMESLCTLFIVLFLIFIIFTTKLANIITHYRWWNQLEFFC